MGKVIIGVICLRAKRGRVDIQLYVQYPDGDRFVFPVDNVAIGQPVELVTDLRPSEQGTNSVEK